MCRVEHSDLKRTKSRCPQLVIENAVRALRVATSAQPGNEVCLKTFQMRYPHRPSRLFLSFDFLLK